MSNPRLGLYDGGAVTMFPRKLMNTATSATLLPASQYARHIENILPNTKKAGSGAKRYGFATKGAAIGGGVVIREIMEFRTSAGVLEWVCYCSDGAIRKFDGSTYTSLLTGLTSNGNPRFVAFNEKLIIADGKNSLMAYDGSTCAAIKEWVVDYDGPGTGGLASAASQTDTNTITVTVGTGRSDYSIGQRVRVTFATAGAVTATITGVSGTTTKTIDVSGTPFPSPSETINKVEYEYTAPAFSDIYAEHNRLWALSAGESKANTWRDPADAMKIYYTDATNNEAAWVNATLQEIGYVSLLNRARLFDELVKITSIDGAMVFLGRHNMYLYQGDDPTTVGEFVWAKTIPVGCVNGNLVQKYPSDILFFTRYGARSLRTVFQTEGKEVVPDLGSDVDSTVTDFVSSMMASDATFRNARSFFYERDGFYGFNFGGDYVLAYALSEESKGWVYLSGFFKDATAYCGTSDGRLFIAVNDQIYVYTNGADATAGTSYDDDGSTYLMKWQSPWLSPRYGRWSNVGFELVLEETSSTTVELYYAKDWQDTSQKGPFSFTLQEEGAAWDVDYWDEAYWDAAAKRPLMRQKFLADSFSFIIQNQSTVGPIAVLGIKPIGR